MHDIATAQNQTIDAQFRLAGTDHDLSSTLPSENALATMALGRVVPAKEI